MSDVFSLRKRSEVMSLIRATGNATTEVRLARTFRAEKITGWRRHIRLGKTRPDFVFSHPKIAIFVDGCFWHGCRRCRRNLKPSTNRAFWIEKIETNRSRDRRNSRWLRAQGWSVIRIWEHALKTDPVKAIGSVRSLARYGLKRA